MSSSSTSGVADIPRVRRSSRPSPAKKASQMIKLPADSGRSVRRHDEDSDTDTSVYQAPTKRKRDDPATDEASSDHSKASRPHRKLKNPRKSTSGQQSKSSQKSSCSQQAQGSQMDAGTNGSQAVTLKINLVQDSNEENEKVAKKPKKEQHYDNIRDYFDEMETYINVSFLLFPLYLFVDCFFYFISS
ncbi:uncharacterized protein MELLADRAFT_89478 [Melampsora larici-populina 98AG31]|uniref:Uncharacterized protein n=1 Tax=Melampsora larici-populina (strain 98AG31 / pathotype 3-4-7) TaxID=747676 RepID=F4RTI5_MELLP|nr:uncharacterized protein MELLADRAFT_89478 [Melampsora larici-populina 98AG31]EGG04262.1 hypothetical protein MELLADRAFT_89478 [Melampsora larici-populina 98AG31]